jgi:hypothetical protein
MLFMPWRWSRWTWCSIVPMLMIAYFLSAIPVERIVRQKINYRLVPLVKTFYCPVRVCVKRSTGLRRVLDHENAIMNRILGPEFICAQY